MTVTQPLAGNLSGYSLDELNPFQSEVRAFVAECVEPHGDAVDRDASIPKSIIKSMAEARVFASGFPEQHGGLMSSDDPVGSAIRHGVLHEALGAASASVQGLVNVHHMAGSSIVRWGSQQQKEEWIPRLTSGDVIAAIAMTEPNTGSDAARAETKADYKDGAYELNGVKQWITWGQKADVFVLLASCDQGPAAFLIPKDTPGLTIEPMEPAMGCRGYMLARLHLKSCRVSDSQILGRPGFGFSHVIAAGLDSGRLNLAWGCAGLARACLEKSIHYAKNRSQFGQPISEFQLIQQKISRMITDQRAASLMCLQASRLRGLREHSAIQESAMAKYFSSTMVNRVASDALQIHGAHGAGKDYPIERYVRDARIMEIIEGTTQILEVAIAKYGLSTEA